MLPFVGTTAPCSNLPDYDPTVLRAPYTTAYCGSYDGNNRVEGTGSHPGVDIGVQYVPALAVGNGEIVLAENSQYGFGNCVVLKMEGVPDNNGTLFVCYAHLKSFNVAVGDLVLKGEPIAITGNTGASTGAHLHFQIDISTSKFHPYWPFSAADLSRRRLTNWEAINQGIAEDKVRANTLSPLVVTQKYRAFTPPEFVDIGKSVARAAIRKLQLAGIFSGTFDNKFEPDAPLTRAAAVKTALLTTGRRVNTKIAATTFRDVKKADWFAPFIAAAVKYGVVTGTNGNFQPNTPVVLVEFLKMLVVAAGLRVPKSGATKFTDVPAKEWFAPFVVAADSAGWLTKSGTTLNPAQPLTRSAAAELAAQALLVR